MDILERSRQFLDSLGFHTESKGSINLPFLIGNGKMIRVSIIATNNRELRIQAENVLKGGMSQANELNRTLHGGIRCVVTSDERIDLLCDLPEYITTGDMFERAIVESLFRIYFIAEIC